LVGPLSAWDLRPSHLPAAVRLASRPVRHEAGLFKLRFAATRTEDRAAVRQGAVRWPRAIQPQLTLTVPTCISPSYADGAGACEFSNAAFATQGTIASLIALLMTGGPRPKIAAATAIGAQSASGAAIPTFNSQSAPV
jgi:hypothetical protein